MTHEGDASRGGALAGQGDGGVAGHQLEHAERDERDAEQHDDQLQQASDDVGDQETALTRCDTPCAAGERVRS